MFLTAIVVAALLELVFGPLPQPAPAQGLYAQSTHEMRTAIGESASGADLPVPMLPLRA